MKHLTISVQMWTIVLCLIFLLAGASGVFAGGVDLVRPDTAAAAARHVPQAALQAHEARKGGIALNVHALLADVSLESGDSVNVSFFPDAAFSVIIRSVDRQADGTLSMTGHIQGQDLDTFVLTLGRDGFLITLQDLEQGMVYRASGQAPEQGSGPMPGRAADRPGAVTEIDISRLPPAMGMPPLLPPAEE